MKFPNVKRYLSGILAAMLVLSSCGPTTTVYADEEDWPSLEEVIDQLDEDEIVRASDYEVAVGSDFNVHVDFANLDIPDPSRVSINLDEAVNGDGEWFRTDHEDSFRTTYSVEPVSGHPVYRISRNIRVRGRSQGSTPAPQTTSVPKPREQSVSSTDSSSVTGGNNGDPENGGSGDESTKETGDDDPSDAVSAGSTSKKEGTGDQASPIPGSDSSGEDPSTDISAPEKDTAGHKDETDHSTDAVQAGNAPLDGTADMSRSDTGNTSGRTSLSDDSLPDESLSDESLSDEAAGLTDLDTENDEEKGGFLSRILSFAESLVGAPASASIDASVDCFSGGSTGAAYVNHVYQTSGNSAGDRVVYCGEIDMHFEAGVHTRQELVGNSLQGHVVTEAEALNTGIMQHYFFYVSGIETETARALTQRAVWAMAVGDNSPSVNNYHWLEVSGLTGVYDAGKAYAAANASRFVLDEAYALVNGATQKLVYIAVKEKPTDTPTPTPTSTPTPTPTPRPGKAKIIKRSSVDAVEGSADYSLKGAVYGIYKDSDCTKKLTQLTTDESGTTKEYSLEAGTYYVKEISAPKNFRLNNKVYTLTVKAGETATVSATDSPESGSVSILKVSEDGGSMSVKGTEYTVYKDPECTSPTGILTVGADGKSNVLSLYYGTYYVKETKAAEGYATDDTIHTVRLTTTETKELKVSDKVLRAGIRLVKTDADLGENRAQGTATLKGAEITITNESEYEVTADGKTYAKGEAVLVLTTDADGTAATKADALQVGKYSWKETKAPAGYGIGQKSSGTFEITADKAGTVIDLAGQGPVDEVLKAGVKIGKLDHELDAQAPQGDALLSGAVIEIASENGTPVYVEGRKYEKGETVKTLTTGSNGTAATAGNTLPLGKYSWKETKAPEGYLLSGKTSGTFTLKEENAGKIVDLGKNCPADDVIRGGVKIGKWEKETKRRDPQGSSSLENTAFVIINKSGASVLVDGKLYENGATIATVRTDKTGYWESKEKWLPYGTYTILETEAPEGHLKGTVQVTFQIRKDGETVDLDKGQFNDQVFRGDLELVKAGQNNKERLADVAFLITSRTTGEAHVLVTDPNGQAGTGTSYAAHTANTNKNDEAYKDGTVDDAKLSHAYGIWFSGESDVTVEPDDAKGALPYDTYNIQELRCAGNEGYELVSYDITVYRDGVTVNSGTVDDEEIPKVEIGTEAMNDKAKTPEGYHLALAEENTELRDRIRYEGLTAGKTYTLKTVLMDRNTGTVVQDADGREVTAETQVKVHLWNRSGTVEVPVVFDARGLEGHSVVFFEYLYDEDGKEAGKHTDIEDEEQTISFPKAETQASDAVTKTNIVLPAKDIKVKDILAYENLIVGKEYLATGTLMDKQTGKPVTDDDGNPVTARKRFTAETKDGSVEILFEFSGVKLAGTVMVAFETVSVSGVEIMTHADINDDDQTVYVPSLGTTASCKETGMKEIDADGVHTILDHVSYSALPEGRYVMQGTLMNKETGGAFIGADGKALTSEKEFDVTEMSGTVDIPFAVDASAFAGRSVVVFEKAFRIREDGTREDSPAAVHEDLQDEEQTVTFPVIRTVLLDKVSGSHTAEASGKVTHIDTVTYSGLTAGKEYTVKGSLLDKETGALIMDNGKEVTAEKTFKAEKPDGTVEMVFTFNASVLAGKTVVAFEDLYRDGKHVAAHEDLSDEDQSIHYPKIRTELKDKGTGSHYVPAVGTVTLTDTVSYNNLIPGKTYKVSGVLMDKKTEKAFPSEDKAIKSSAEFTPDRPDGTVDLEFTVNGAALAGRSVVAFETLFEDSVQLAVHADITDAAQTVHSPSIRTVFINNETGSHSAEAMSPRNFTDSVSCTNLEPSAEYVMRGILMDKETGKTLRIGGKEITAEKVFRPADTSGYVELPFAFDCTSLAGKTVVAFEYLYRGNVLIACHTDIDDEAQTVTIDRKPTPTPTGRPTSTPVPSKKVSGTPSSSRTPSSSGTAVRTAGPVKTGDTTNIILPVVLLGAAAAAIGYIFVKRKKI